MTSHQHGSDSHCRPHPWTESAPGEACACCYATAPQHFPSAYRRTCVSAAAAAPVPCVYKHRRQVGNGHMTKQGRWHSSHAVQKTARAHTRHAHSCEGSQQGSSRAGGAGHVHGLFGYPASAAAGACSAGCLIRSRGCSACRPTCQQRSRAPPQSQRTQTSAL